MQRNAADPRAPKTQASPISLITTVAAIAVRRTIIRREAAIECIVRCKRQARRPEPARNAVMIRGASAKVTTARARGTAVSRAGSKPFQLGSLPKSPITSNQSSSLRRRTLKRPCWRFGAGGRPPWALPQCQPTWRRLLATTLYESWQLQQSGVQLRHRTTTTVSRPGRAISYSHRKSSSLPVVARFSMASCAFAASDSAKSVAGCTSSLPSRTHSNSRFVRARRSSGV